MEISPEISHSVAGGISAVLDHDTVGNDISSATQGSSVINVAGKNRAPTKQCANALEVDASAIELASANESGTYRDIRISPVGKRESIADSLRLRWITRDSCAKYKRFISRMDGGMRASPTDLHVDAYLLEVLPVALLFHPAHLAARVRRSRLRRLRIRTAPEHRDQKCPHAHSRNNSKRQAR